jgi:hypothetical protein
MKRAPNVTPTIEIVIRVAFVFPVFMPVFGTSGLSSIIWIAVKVIS